MVLHPGESFSFWLEPTFPVTTAHCYLHPLDDCLASCTFEVHNNNPDNGVGTATPPKKCSYVISEVPGWDPTSNQFTVSPKIKTGPVRNPFLVSVDFLPVPAHDPQQIYDGYTIQSIPVSSFDYSSVIIHLFIKKCIVKRALF